MINLEFIANEIQFARKAWIVYFWSCCSDRSGFEVEHEHQELFISNLYPAILVRVIESESTSQSLEHHTALDEIVEGHSAPPLSVKLPDQYFIEFV